MTYHSNVVDDYFEHADKSIRRTDEKVIRCTKKKKKKMMKYYLITCFESLIKIMIILKNLKK